MKTIHILDKCWNTDLWVICPAQHRELNRFISRQFGIQEKTARGEFVGRFVEITGDDGDEYGGVIALKQWKGTPRDYAVLAHECLHAVHWFLDNRGLKLNFKSDEAFCYLMDSFIRRAIEGLKK